jgi:ribonucleoside-diphosphate reductase alpha chain
VTRERLEDERRSVTHRFTINSEAGMTKGYVIVGLYPDGRPGELFVRIAKEGSTLASLVDAWAIAVSIALQSGVGLGVLVSKFAHCRFEPSGYTGNPDIRIAKSPIDYIARWMGLRFKDHLDGKEDAEPFPAPPAPDPPDGMECTFDGYRPIATTVWERAES